MVDFGIRGFDLAYALLDGYERDDPGRRLPARRRAGTLYVIEPDLTTADERNGAQRRYGSARNGSGERAALGGIDGRTLKRVLLVGCEPADARRRRRPRWD